MSDDLLRVEGVSAGYGASRVLDEMTFAMGTEAACIVGRNGMGKTTFCNVLMGLVPMSEGQIVFDGKRIDGLAPEKIARHGIAYVPQGRRLFPSLTVDEHLQMLARDARGKRWTPEAVYGLFPRLSERRRNGGAELSGGEQQMLAVGRAYMSGRQIMVLDEPSMGLAPLLMLDMFDAFKEINRQGTTILLVEQNARLALKFAQRGYVLEHGQLILEGEADGLLDNPEVKKAYLGA